MWNENISVLGTLMRRATPVALLIGFLRLDVQLVGGYLMERGL